MKAVAPRRAFSALIASVALAALLSVAPVAQAQKAAAPTIVVNFTAAGVVTVALPDGTPVGTTSGTPTTIPAGYYTLVLNGPGTCISLPLLEIRGPGVYINDDMLGGETDTHVLYADFQPNTTYTWHLDRTANIVYTFRTNATVVGAPQQSTVGTTTTTPTAAPKPTSEDVTGSDIVPFRGTLAVSVTSVGSLSLAYKGKPVSALKAGRYSIAAVDRSKSGGVMLEKLKHKPVSVTGITFVGKRSTSLVLTAGKWLVMPRAGKTAYSIVVN